jgi:hypothetical protein
MDGGEGQISGLISLRKNNYRSVTLPLHSSIAPPFINCPMKLKARSLVFTTIIAVSAGGLLPASVHSTDAPPKSSTETADTCSTMLVPEGVTCMVSPRTGQSIAVAQMCQVMASVISYPSGMNPLKTGLGLIGTGAICKIDPQTGLVIGILNPTQIKALPPIKSRQQRGRSILAAATAAKGEDACTGMNVPAGMICVVDPTTGRAKAYWNDCLRWVIPAGVACVVDPVTGTAMTVVRPD